MRPCRMLATTSTANLSIEPSFSRGILVFAFTAVAIAIPIATALSSAVLLLTFDLEDTSLVTGSVPLLIDGESNVLLFEGRGEKI